MYLPQKGSKFYVPPRKGVIGVIISEIAGALSDPWVKELLKVEQWLSEEQRSGVGGKAGCLNYRLKANP